jgi:hypothetical protein
MKTVFYCFILTLILISCRPAGLKNDTPDEPVDHYATEGTVTVTESNPFDNVTQTTDGYHYWYVYFSAGNEMEGFLIVKSTKPGFSLNETILAIQEKWPSHKDDYIGVHFFAEVNQDCYNEYYED